MTKTTEWWSLVDEDGDLVIDGFTETPCLYATKQMAKGEQWPNETIVRVEITVKRNGAKQ